MSELADAAWRYGFVLIFALWTMFRLDQFLAQLIKCQVAHRDLINAMVEQLKQLQARQDAMHAENLKAMSLKLDHLVNLLPMWDRAQK